MALLSVGGVVGVLASFVSPTLDNIVRPHAIWLASAVAIAGTVLSLVLSEGVGLAPCVLCWWQRIFMYPLAIMLPIAAFTKDLWSRRYTLPLALAGFGVALYQVWIQAFPGNSPTCSVDAPCDQTLVNALGFMTIPRMSLAGFFIIIVLLLRNRVIVQEA